MDNDPDDSDLLPPEEVDRLPNGQLLLEAPPKRPELLWQQWPEESEHWYSCFLIYLALGPNRNLQAAYQAYFVHSKLATAQVEGDPRPSDIVVPHVSSTWRRACDRFHWEERAGRYDVYTLSQLVPQTVQIIFAAIGEFAKVALEQLQSRSVVPTTWNEMQTTLETLASFISPEIIQETVRHSADYSGRAGLTGGGDVGDDDIPPDPSDELEALG